MDRSMSHLLTAINYEFEFNKHFDDLKSYGMFKLKGEAYVRGP